MANKFVFSVHQYHSRLSYAENVLSEHTNLYNKLQRQHEVERIKPSKCRHLMKLWRYYKKANPSYNYLTMQQMKATLETMAKPDFDDYSFRGWSVFPSILD